MNKTPLGWFFEPKKDDQQVIGYYMGSVATAGDIVKVKLDDSSVPITKEIRDISYSFSSSWTTSDIPWNFMAIGDGGKKTLHVTKKSDIKFD